jgi:Sec-independent protein secretion pathway component TatC
LLGWDLPSASRHWLSARKGKTYDIEMAVYTPTTNGFHGRQDRVAASAEEGMMQMNDAPAMPSPYPAHRLWVVVAVLIGALLAGSLLTGPGAMMLGRPICGSSDGDCYREFIIALQTPARPAMYAVAFIAGLTLALPVTAHLLIGWIMAARAWSGGWLSRLVGPWLALALLAGGFLGLGWVLPTRVRLGLAWPMHPFVSEMPRPAVAAAEILLTVAWTALLAQVVVLMVILTAFGLVRWQYWRDWWRQAFIGSVVLTMLGASSRVHVITLAYAVIVFMIYLIGLGFARIVAALPWVAAHSR